MGNSDDVRHARPEESRFRSWVREYRVEIVGLAVVALGIFLLMERMNIRATLFAWLRNILAVTVGSLIRLGDSATGFLARLTVSDLIGALLILGAAVALAWRVRWRLMRSPSLVTLRCPRCGGSIYRVHRHSRDRVVSLFMPVRRYRCGNRGCRWDGLRVGASHHSTSGASPGRVKREAAKEP